MLELASMPVLLLVGVITGFLDSIIGAGGLFSIPSLIFFGLPPQVAIATDRFGTIGQTITALFKFQKAKKILWKWVPLFTGIALVGSLIGAESLISIGQESLQWVTGLLLIAVLPFIFIKRDLGVKQLERSKTKTIIGLLLYFLVMILGGFFGQGTGPLVFYVLTYFLGFTMIEILATGIIPWFFLSISSLVIFAINGIIDYKIGLILLVGMAIGGYLGAHIAVKKGDLWVKRIFVLFVIVSSIKLIFF